MSDTSSDDGLADTAGIPWRGRALAGTGFDDDTGAADPRVVRALEARARQPSTETDAGLVRAVRDARWVVPVVAVRAETEGGGHGHEVEKSTDMAVVTLATPDGRRALPAFSSTAELAAWDASARPVPVTASRMAQAAVAEGCEVIVVDLASDGATELRPSMVWALAQQTDWLPAHTDPFVVQSISRAVEDIDAIGSHRVEEGAPPGDGVLRVVLALRPGLDSTQVQAVATRVAQRLATDGEFRARVDALTFTIEPTFIG